MICLLSVLSLECYVCHNQDGNTAKCLKTIQTCEYEHDRCMSIIRWSTEPYWTQVNFPFCRNMTESRIYGMFYTFVPWLLDRSLTCVKLSLNRELRSSTTCLKSVPPRRCASKRSRAICPSATTYGTRTGDVQSAARGTDVTITSRYVFMAFYSPQENTKC